MEKAGTLRGGFGMAALVILAGACTPPREEALRVLVRTPFAGAPAASGHALGGVVTGNACEGLVAFDMDLRLVPALATSWSTPADTTWRFAIRRNVSFHDGRIMTARDVKHSLDRALSRPDSWPTSRLPQVTRTQAVGEHSLEIETAGPEPLLLSMLAGICVAPTGSEVRASVPLVATGPYRLSRLDHSQKAVFERHGAYWRGRPRWGRAEFEFEPDGHSRVARLVAGGADLVETPPAETLPTLAEDRRFRVIQEPGTQVVVLSLDVRAGPFADRKVRQALAQSLDREALARDALGGRASPATQLATRGVFGFDPKRQVASPDVRAARASLLAADRPAGLAVPLLFTQRDVRVAEAIANQAAPAGIRFELVELPFGELDERLQARSAPAAIYIVTFPNMDASDVLLDLHTRSPDGRRGLFNFSGHSDPELDLALARSDDELDMHKRLAHLGRAMDRALDSNALIPLVFLSDVFAARQEIRWHGNGLGRIRIEDIARQ